MFVVWLGELDGAARAAPSCARSAIAPETMVAPVAANTSGGGREGLREEEELGLASHGGQSIARRQGRGSHWNHQLTKSAPLFDSSSSTQPTEPWALPGSPMNGLPSPSAVWYAVP